MLKKENVVSHFYTLMGSISTTNFCKGRPSALLSELDNLEDEFTFESLEEVLEKFDGEKSYAVHKIREKFVE